MTTNCPNCGAPIDISRSSCEYCGTPYEKSNDIRIEVTAPDPSVEDFIEVLSRISRRSGINLMDSTTLYADNQAVRTYNQFDATAWKPTPEEERKMIEDMRNVAAPMIFPKVEPTVEYIKYNTKLERLTDAVWFWFVVLIITIGCSLLPFIIF